MNLTVIVLLVSIPVLCYACLIIGIHYGTIAGYGYATSKTPGHPDFAGVRRIVAGFRRRAAKRAWKRQRAETVDRYGIGAVEPESRFNITNSEIGQVNSSGDNVKII